MLLEYIGLYGVELLGSLRKFRLKKFHITKNVYSEKTAIEAENGEILTILDIFRPLNGQIVRCGCLYVVIPDGLSSHTSIPNFRHSRCILWIL